MNVFRIEHRITGIGPYHCKKRNDELCDAHNGNQFRPCAFVDVMIPTWRKGDNERFACPTLELLLDWFDGFIDYLFDRDYIIKQYHANDVVIGFSGRQCCFNYNTATVIKKFELYEVI